MATRALPKDPKFLYAVKVETGPIDPGFPGAIKTSVSYTGPYGLIGSARGQAKTYTNDYYGHNSEERMKKENRYRKVSVVRTPVVWTEVLPGDKA